MQTSRRRRAGIAVVAAAMTMTACGGTGSSSMSLTVYSGQHEQTMAALVADFTKRTGVQVRLRSSDEASLANQVLREGAASPADVFVAENPPALTVLERKGLFAPVAAAALAKTPARYNDPKGEWVAVSARAAALAYDTDELKTGELPRRLADLALPAWRGKVGFAPTETDFQPLITAFATLHGAPAATAWLKALKANGKVYDDNEALIAAVNRGEIATGLVDHYYWYRLRDELGASKMHSKLHYLAPGDAGALVDVSGAAQLRSSKHVKQAQQLLDYLVSVPAQTIIATSESYEYPLGSGVRTRRDLQPLATLRPPQISVDDLGDGRSALRALQDVGLL